MAIQIKEFVPSDSLSAAIDKLNYNFDQLILAGGGPEGPQGPQGIIGPAGSKGDKGTQWFYNTVSGTAGTTLPATIFSGDKIVDADGQVWEYNGTSWFDTGLNLQGPQGTAGSAGSGGEFLRYIGDGTISEWFPDANGNQSPLATGNSEPNFFGYFDINDANSQGIDPYVFGHLRDVSSATNRFGKANQPRLYVLQSNASNGITIGLGSEASTNTSLSITAPIDFRTHAKLFKDINGKFIIQGSDTGANAVQSEIEINAINNSKVSIQGNASSVRVGHHINNTGIGINIQLKSEGQIELDSQYVLTSLGCDIDELAAGPNYYSQKTTSGDRDSGYDVKFESGSDGKFYIKKFKHLDLLGSGSDSLGIYIRPDMSAGNGARFRSINGAISNYELFTELSGSIAGKLLIDSGEIIMQSKGNLPVQIGQDVSAHGSGRRYLGMFDSSEDDFRISMGKTKSSGVERYSNIDYHTANGSPVSRFYTGSYMASEIAKAFSLNMHGDYLSIGGKFKASSSSSNYDEVHHAITVTTNRSAYGDKRASVGFGGIPKANWSDDYKAAAHFWGGFRFHGSDPIYNENASSMKNKKYSSIGYRFKDMLFATQQDLINEDTYDGKFDVGIDQVGDNKSETGRSKIFIGSRTSTPLTDEAKIGFFNIFSNRTDTIPHLYFQTDSRLVGAEMSVNSSGSSRHSGISPADEFYIRSYGSHIVMKPASGASIYLNSDRTINLETTTDGYSINLTSAEDVNITSDDDTIVTADYAQFKAKGVWYRGDNIGQALHTRTSFENRYSTGITELPSSGIVRTSAVIRAQNAGLVIRSDADHTTEIQRSWRFNGAGKSAPRGKRMIFGNGWGWGAGQSLGVQRYTYGFGMCDDANSSIASRVVDNLTITQISSLGGVVNNSLNQIDHTENLGSSSVRTKLGWYISYFFFNERQMRWTITFDDPFDSPPVVNATLIGANNSVTTSNVATVTNTNTFNHIHYNLVIGQVSANSFTIALYKPTSIEMSSWDNDITASKEKLFFSFTAIEPDNDRNDNDSLSNILNVDDLGGGPAFLE